MSRPLLLDLFCGAGGAAMGYHRAGFDVVGVDINPQPRFPFRFVRADALEYIANHGREYDVIHASPPCQGYAITKHLRQCRKDYPLLIEETRGLLLEIGTPYVMENVVGAPLHQAVKLCGLMFGLKVFRHRLFESSLFLMQMGHPSHRGKRIGFDGYCCVAGHGFAGRDVKVDPYHRRKSTWEKAMGIDWMSKQELTQAVPPDYTEYIGRQLLNQVRVAAREAA